MGLRVAVVHSFYSSNQPSGENTQVESEVEALTRAGLDVALFAARTDQLEQERFYRTRCLVRVMSGHGASPLHDLEAWRPDIVHIHNLFPNFGRRWVTGLSPPVVTTVHNYRFTCANGVLQRDGHPCTDCPDGDRTSALRHRCYRGSLAATIPVAIGQARGPADDPLLARADRILCLSARQRDILMRAGVPDQRLVDWSNFLPEHIDPGRRSRSATQRCGSLYVGRLSAEKGVLELVDSWSGHEPLRVVGDGPLIDEVRRAAVGRQVDLLGRVSRPEALELMAGSAALIMPGTVHELAPLTYMEALACGLPVVVRPSSDLSPQIAAGGLGRVVERVGDMAAAAADLARDGDIARRCREAYEALYTERTWSRRVTALYAQLSDRRTVGSTR